MPFFLIPVAVVGYKMWERRMREEKEREELQRRDGSIVEKVGEHENEEEPSPFLSQESIESEANTCNLSLDEEPITGMAVGTSHDRHKQESSPYTSMTSFFEDEQRREKNETDLLNIQIKKEKLTDEVLGNQGTNVLPLCCK